MNSDYKPILFNTAEDVDEMELFAFNDEHYGNIMHDYRRWDALKRMILEKPNRYVVWVGDMMENATRNSKGDIFYQEVPPHEQKLWLRDQFIDLRERTLGVVPGNHELRSSRDAGMFPVYDAAVMAGIEDKYRSSFMFIDIGVGLKSNKQRQVHYVGFCIHKATNQVRFGSVDAIDGIDFFISGHDHQPADRPRGKLVYDAKNKCVTHKNVEHINCGSLMNYGGYAAEGGYRPSAQKLYCIKMSGKKKCIRTEGFYV